MICLLIAPFLTWDPFTLVLNYTNPCECFCYKYSSCLLTCDVNFYDHRITIISLFLSENLYSPFDKRNSKCFANIPFTPANMNHCPHFTRIAIPPFRQIVRQRKVLTHTQGQALNSKRAKFWKSSDFSIIKYTLLYARDEFP